MLLRLLHTFQLFKSWVGRSTVTSFCSMSFNTRSGVGVFRSGGGPNPTTLLLLVLLIEVNRQDLINKTTVGFLCSVSLSTRSGGGSSSQQEWSQSTSCVRSSSTRSCASLRAASSLPAASCTTLLGLGYCPYSANPTNWSKSMSCVCSSSTQSCVPLRAASSLPAASCTTLLGLGYCPYSANPSTWSRSLSCTESYEKQTVLDLMGRLTRAPNRCLLRPKLRLCSLIIFSVVRFLESQPFTARGVLYYAVEIRGLPLLCKPYNVV